MTRNESEKSSTSTSFCGREADPERLGNVFALEDGCVIWVSGEAGAEAVDSASFAEILSRGRRPRPDYGERFEMLSLEVVDGKLAVAKVEFSFSGGSYVDVLVLYKIDGGWRIVTKTYVVRPSSRR